MNLNELKELLQLFVANELNELEFNGVKVIKHKYSTQIEFTTPKVNNQYLTQDDMFKDLLGENN